MLKPIIIGFKTKVYKTSCTCSVNAALVLGELGVRLKAGRPLIIQSTEPTKQSKL